MLVRRIVREQDLGDARNLCGRLGDRPAFLAGDEDMDIAARRPRELSHDFRRGGDGVQGRGL